MHVGWKALLGCVSALIVAGPAAGCLGLQVDQCLTNADCQKRGANFDGFVCGAAHTCVEPAKASGGQVIAGDAGAGCQSTDLCTAANGGRPSLCRVPGEPCTPLATSACPVILGKWSDPNAIFFGALSQNRTADIAGAVYGQALEKALELGIGEIEKTVGGLSGPNNTRRPIAVVACQAEALEPAQQVQLDVSAIAQHLIGDVKVNAIFTVDDHLNNPLLQSVLQSNTFTMCTFCQTDPASTTRGIVWHGLQNWTSGAPLFNYGVSFFEQRIRANPAYGVGATSPIRVALTSGQSDYLGGLADGVVAKLQFNGKPLQQNLPNFLRTANANWIDPANSQTVFQAVQQIIAFNPHIVLVANDLEGSRLIIPLIEGQWDKSKQPPPYYVVNDVQIQKETLTLIGTNESLRKRIFGITPSYDPSQEVLQNLAAFISRIPTVYPAGEVPPLIDLQYSSIAYDAFFAVIYAMAAANVPNPTADDIRNGFSKIGGPGPVINLDPVNFGPGLAALAAGGSVQLRGTFSAMKWDLQAHRLVGYNAGFCAIRDQSTGNATWGDFGPFQVGTDPVQPGAPTCY